MASSHNLESSDHSSPESYELEDDSNEASSAQWPLPGQTASDGTLPSQPTRATQPMQKRRRVTRACDECRRKKIKCDGKQPCTHCTVYSYGKVTPYLYIRSRCINVVQIAHMTSHRIVEEIPHRSTLKLWRAACSVPKHSSAPLFLTLISKIPILILYRTTDKQALDWAAQDPIHVHQMRPLARFNKTLKEMRI